MARGRMRIMAGLVRPADFLPVITDVMTTADCPAGDPLSINWSQVYEVPGWCPDRTCNFMLFNGGHDTDRIRGAEADEFLGPYNFPSPTQTDLTLDALDAYGYWGDPGTRAPDGHVSSLAIFYADETSGIFRALVHGLTTLPVDQSSHGAASNHNTWVVESTNLKNWTFVAGPVGKVIESPFFFRPFFFEGELYSASSTGVLRKCASPDGLGLWDIQSEGAKHFSELVRDDAPAVPLEPRHFGYDFSRIGEGILVAYFSRTGQDPPPERIFVSLVDLNGDWNFWQMSECFEFARPVLDWEGVNVTLRITGVGEVVWPANVLMDMSDVIDRNNKRYCSYCGGGEHTNAIAELNELTTA